MEVNLSARQIDHPEIVATVERILEDTGLPPANLTLEITESALMNDAASALRVLRALKELGVTLAIDDFGTGYSSLSHLQRFPLDILKIDKSFVDELGRRPGRARDRGRRGEAGPRPRPPGHRRGVETERQLEVLRRLDCDFAQGYLFSRPVPGRRAGRELPPPPRRLTDPWPRAPVPDRALSPPAPRRSRDRRRASPSGPTGPPGKIGS